MCDFGYDKQLMVYDRFAIERDAYNLAPESESMLPIRVAGSMLSSVYSSSPSNHSRK